jgi:Cof subfamily protein (haloacid dehalogenase superfamily)
MIKLICSDMDGTLLDAKMTISPENLAAIDYAQHLGIEFVLATGRSYHAATAPLAGTPLHTTMIILNGAQIYDKSGEPEFTWTIDKEKVNDVLDLLDQNKIYYEVSTNHGLYSESQARRIESFAVHVAEQLPHLSFKTAIAMASANLANLQIHYTDSIRKVLADPEMTVLKIIFTDARGAKALGPVANKIDQLGGLAITSSGQYNIEVNHQNAQKGIAVVHLAKMRNIPLSEVMTIGDNYNDISMLEAGGVSFAMGNADAEVKEHAKFITDTNLENGFAQAVYRAIKENL